MAIIISIGKWGGVYAAFGFGWRLCLGWVAISIFPIDGDVLIDMASRYGEMTKGAGVVRVEAESEEG